MIIVRFKRTDKDYILLGAGYGAYKAQGQAGWGSIPSTSKGEIPIVAICDETGEIDWVLSKDIYVVSVDGVDVADALTRERGFGRERF